MSDMPERIWASGGHVIEWDTTIGTFSALRDPNRTEYRRADAPPTVAEAMQCPEVRALVREVQRYMPIIGEAVDGYSMGQTYGIATANAIRHRLRPFTEGQEGE